MTSTESYLDHDLPVNDLLFSEHYGTQKSKPGRCPRVRRRSPRIAAVDSRMWRDFFADRRGALSILEYCALSICCTFPRSQILQQIFRAVAHLHLGPRVLGHPDGSDLLLMLVTSWF